MGADVTVVEVLRNSARRGRRDFRFRPQGVREAGHQDSYWRQGHQARQESDQVAATIDDGKGGTQTLTVERVISAVGVTGNIENLGLEKVGVKTERGAVVIDALSRTSVPGIYAIGDVAGPPLLAHKAEHEGVTCVEAIKGLKPHPMDKRLIPGCTYCSPQIASVGLTEQAAKEKKLDIRVGRFPFVGNARRSRSARTRGS